MSMVDMLSASQQATGTQTRGRTPIFRIQLSGEPIELTVLEAEINMGENRHDVGTLRVTSSERTNTNGILEAPITFLFGVAPKTEVFCGYVTSVTEVQSESGVLTWTMGVTGPTKPMMAGNPRFWTQRSIPSAVEALASLSYLGYAGHAHPHLWQTLAQTEDSDWRTITKLAKRLGWSVFQRYGVVLLYDPLVLFKDQGISATLMSETYTLAKSAIDQERTLLEFDPTEEAESSTTQQGHKVAYFNDGKVQVATQKGDHSNYRFITDFVIRDAEEAALYVNSDDSDASNWRQSARARIMGNASLYPGMSVEIMTTNQKYFTGKFNGRWLIRAVQHKMDRQDYQSNLVLARPDGTTKVFTGTYTPFWQTLTKSRPTLSLFGATALPGTITLFDTQKTLSRTTGWVSSWANPTFRSVL